MNISSTPLGFWDFWGIYRAKRRARGTQGWAEPTRARLGLLARPAGFCPPLDSPQVQPGPNIFLLVHKKSPWSFVAFGVHLILILCDVFVGIWWTSSLWSVISFLYPWKLFEFLWSLICMISYRLVFLLWYLVLFGQLDLFILQWEEVPGSGFDLTVLDPSDRKGNDTYVSLLLRIKRWGLLHR